MLRRRLRVIWFSAGIGSVATLLLAAACSNPDVPSAVNKPGIRTVTDDLGRTVQIPEKIDRAVSLAPSLTEIIFAAGAGDKLVGVTTYCNYPAETASIEKVGDTQTPNIERLIALKPQIVFVSTASQLEAFINILDEQSISVFVTESKDLEGVYKNLEQLGNIFGTSARAEKVAGELRARMAELDEGLKALPKIPTFVQISADPLFTIGKDSFLTDAIEHAGAISVTKDVPTAYPKLSKETAAAMEPDVIILSDSEDNRVPNTAFKNSPAVRNGFVYRIDADKISRPGPRLVDALEQIAGLLNK